jgi:hypothetical protein
MSSNLGLILSNIEGLDQTGYLHTISATVFSSIAYNFVIKPYKFDIYNVKTPVFNLPARVLFKP